MEVKKTALASGASALYSRVKKIVEAAQGSVARSVNTTQVVAYWLIGQEIVNEEQKGNRRAEYGQRIINDLSLKLTKELGVGYSVANLKNMRQFYLSFEELIDDNGKSYAVRSQLGLSKKALTVPDRFDSQLLPSTGTNEVWKPGKLHPNLSWTHYRALLRIDKKEARAFYEIESIKNSWKARELEWQINSLLYERLALSKDKKGLLKLSTKGHEIQQPKDVFKDPMVIEFLGLPESPKLVESELEQAH